MKAETFNHGETGQFILEASRPEGNIFFDVHISVDRIKANDMIKKFFKSQKRFYGNQAANKVKGFRNGKVPRHIIERMMGGKEAMYNQIFYSYANTVIMEHAPRKVMNTDDYKIEEGDNGWWDIMFKMFMIPEVVVPNNLYNMNFQVPRGDVDSYVSQRIESFRKLHPYLYAKEDKEGNILSAEEDDMVAIAVESTLDGELFKPGCEEETNIRLIKESISPVSLYDKLLDSKPGDSFSVEVDDASQVPIYWQSVAKDKVFKMNVQVKHVYRCEDAKVDDDLAITAGYDSLDNWNTKLLDQGKRIVEDQEIQLKRQLVLNHIINCIPKPDLPKQYVDGKIGEMVVNRNIVDSEELRSRICEATQQAVVFQAVGENLDVEWDDFDEYKANKKIFEEDKKNKGKKFLIPEPNQYTMDETRYASKVLDLLVEKANFVYVDSGTDGSNPEDRGNEGGEGSSSSNREALAGDVQAQV